MLIQLAKDHAWSVTDVAKACSVSRQSVHNWINKDPEFKEAMDNGNDILVDLAVSGLKHHLEQKSEKTIHYTLDRLARDKGFGKLIKIQDQSKFEDQFDEMSDSELEELAIKTANRINKANG